MIDIVVLLTCVVPPMLRAPLTGRKYRVPQKVRPYRVSSFFTKCRTVERMEGVGLTACTFPF